MPRALGMRSYLFLPATFAFVIGCAGAPREVVSSPPASVEAPTLPAHPSRIEASVSIDLTQILEDLRAQVPPVFRTSDNHGTAWDGRDTDQGWLYVDEGGNPDAPSTATYRVRAEVVRDRVDYMLSGASITFTAAFRYRLHAQRRVLLTWPGGYCGENNRPTIPLVVTGRTDVGSAPRWDLRANTELGITEFGQCEITILGRNVAPGLTPLLRGALERLMLGPIARRLDAGIAAIPLRSRVEALWQQLLAPVAVGPSWLTLHPRALVLDAITGTGGSTANPPRAVVTAAIGLVARPTLTRARPAPSSGDLPDAVAGVGGGVFIEGAVELTYSELDAMLTEAIGGRLQSQRGTIEVTRIASRPAGSGQLAVDVAFSADGVRGIATLVGAPVLDVPTQSASFPDLDFVATTDSTLANIYLWLEQGRLRSRLREAAVLRWSDQLAAVEAALVRGAAAHGIQLTIHKQQIEGVRFDSTIRGVATLSGAMTLPTVTVP